MYVEFSIPNGITGPTALLLLRRDLVDWSLQHRINYTEKTVKNTHRVCFADPEHYTFFRLSWSPRIYLDYNIVDIP